MKFNKKEINDIINVLLFAVKSPDFCGGTGFKTSPGLLIIKLEAELGDIKNK